MKTVGYYNGAIDEVDRMMIPMNDRAIYFGDGVYESAYGARHTIYDLDSHLERFRNGLEVMRIPHPCGDEELRAVLARCVCLFDSDGEFLIYWQCSRGTGDRSHVQRDADGPNLLVTVRPIGLRNLRNPVKILLTGDLRHQLCHIKTLNLIPNVLAKMEAQDAGCDEAVFVREGWVTECAHSNIHIIREDGVISTPTGHSILPGTSQRHLQEVCRRQNIPWREELFTPADLERAQEVFISSSGTFCVAVCQADGKPVGGRAPDLLRKIQRAMLDDFEAVTGFRPDIMD